MSFGAILLLVILGSAFLFIAWLVLGTAVNAVMKWWYRHNIITDPYRQIRVLTDDFVKSQLRQSIYSKRENRMELRERSMEQLDMLILIKKCEMRHPHVTASGCFGLRFLPTNPIWVKLHWSEEAKVWVIEHENPKPGYEHMLSLEQQLQQRGIE